MNNEELKAIVGSNLARLRRDRGLTQAELAERINYSDKAVSKWERGESLPDVLTLLSLAKELGTDLNTLTGCAPEPESAPAQTPDPEPIPDREPVRTEKPKRHGCRADKGVILKLSSILVWIVALFLYMLLDAFGVRHLWVLFVMAVPANAIVLLSLRSAWKMYGWNRILISVIMWGSLLVLWLLLRILLLYLLSQIQTSFLSIFLLVP